MTLAPCPRRGVVGSDVAVPVAAPGTLPAVPVAVPRLSRRARRTVQAGVLVLVLVVEAWLVRDDLGHAFDALADAQVPWLVVAVVAEMMSLGAFARLQRRMLFASGSRMSILRMLQLTYVAQAVSSTFPGGTVLSAGYVLRRLRRWGVSLPAAGFVLVSSVGMSVVTFAVLAGGYALVAGTTSGAGSALLAGGVAVLSLGVLLVVVRRRGSVDRIGTRMLTRYNRQRHRPDDDGQVALQAFVAQLRQVRPRTRDWATGFVFASLNWALELLCLIACCRAVGMESVSLTIVIGSYLVGMTASTIAFTPGGFGVIDAAMIVTLVGGGVASAMATAGVLVFRLLTVVLVALAGWVVHVLNRPGAEAQLPARSR